MALTDWINNLDFCIVLSIEPQWNTKWQRNKRNVREKQRDTTEYGMGNTHGRIVVKDSEVNTKWSKSIVLLPIFAC